MIVTLFDGFRIMDIEILAISLGIRSNLLVEGLIQNAVIWIPCISVL